MPCYWPMQWVIDNIWLILFLAWGMPLGVFRSRFRKMVYETDDWTINIKPYFVKETKALLGMIVLDIHEFKKTRNNYLFYLLVYLILFLVYKFQ
jgi:peroxiredoxin Q/BCP